jgi:glutamate synthase (NADPH/NADH) small chain
VGQTSRSARGIQGPAAAQQLNRAGHTVTVFEKADRIGGLLRYGIPDFKLEKRVLDRRIDLMATEGVVFRPNSHVGGNVSARSFARSSMPSCSPAAPGTRVISKCPAVN